MELITELFNFILHIDIRLAELARDYGVWVYAILFVIVFCETGLVVTPFLPGDSLLFAAGALAGGALAVDGVSTAGMYNVHLLVVLLFIAAVIGDAVNYMVGRKIGPAVFEKKNSRIFRPEYLARTRMFFEKYGSKTIVIARFVPIVRTFAPFLAGVGTMSYPKFAFYNVAGAFVWVTFFMYTGYFFGSTPLVQKNFKLVILAIIIISVMPGIVEVVKARRQARTSG